FYANDGVAGQVSRANVTPTTAADDSSIANLDPDYPHSWWTIRPLTALPEITDPVVVDGFSQPGASPNTLANGNDAVLRVELDGSAPAAALDGLQASGGSNTVRGLVINRFGKNGIVLRVAGNNLVTGNFIGTDVSGRLNLGNVHNGVLVKDAPGNTVGGTAAGARNLISGNGFTGVLISDAGATANVVQGNFIGTNAAGTAAVDIYTNNTGVDIFNASNNT